MGFFATDCEYECREKMYPPSKNRVWGFSASSRPRARRFASQVLEPQQENQPTPTTTASGVHFYGYRFYSPELGRWPSRDPIEEKGGLNVYAFTANRGPGYIDVLGLTGVRVSYIPPRGLPRLEVLPRAWVDVRRDGTVAFISISLKSLTCYVEHGCNVYCSVNWNVSRFVVSDHLSATAAYDASPMSRAGAIGHEQKHFRAYINNVNNLVEEIRSQPGKFRTSAIARVKATEYTRTYRPRFLAMLVEVHGVDGHPEFGEPYPPE